MKILITGGTGFIGSHLVEALSKKNCQLVLVSRSYFNRVTESRFSNKKNIQWLPNDQNLQLELRSFGKFDAILHLATSYMKTGGSFSEIEKTNVAFPLQILDFALDNGCPYFINTDSFFCKHHFSQQTMKEYVLTKQNFSQWGLLATLKKKDFSFINMKLEHVYGPHDSESKFVPFLINSLINSRCPLKLTDCSQSRDFIYVDDVIGAFISVLDSINHPSLKGYVEIEVGTGLSVPVYNFVEQVKKAMRSNVNIEYGAIQKNPNEIMDSKANISTLQNLGWNALIPLEIGIDKTVAYYTRKKFNHSN